MVWHLPTTATLLSWPTPNYHHPVKRGPEIYITTGILVVLTTAAVFTRLYARLFVRRWFGLDDFFIIIGWVSLSPITDLRPV